MRSLVLFLLVAILFTLAFCAGYYSLGLLLMCFKLPLANFDFLSDILAFEAVIAGLVIPLGVEIISRISEQYESEMISKTFSNNWVIKYFPYFLMLNIFLNLALIFAKHLWEKSANGNILAWLSLIFGFFAGLWLLGFIAVLSHHTQTRYVVKELLKNARQTIRI